MAKSKDRVHCTTGQLHIFVVPETIQLDKIDPKISRVNMGLPLFNPGREDLTSWGRPCQELPTDLYQGFDASKGVIVAYDAAQIAALFKALPADVLASMACPDAAKFWGTVAKDPVAAAIAQREKIAEVCRSNSSEVIRYLVDSDDEGKEIFEEVSFGGVSNWITACKAKPKYFALCGQRRTSARFHVEVLRQQRHAAKHPDPDKRPKLEPYTWELTIRDFVNVHETHRMILEENRDSGRRPYSKGSQLRSACLYFLADPTISEARLGQLLDITDTYDPTTGRTKKRRGERSKAHRLARLNAMRPAMNIAERLTMAPTYDADNKVVYEVGGYLPPDKLDKEDLSCLLGVKDCERTKQTRVCDALEATDGFVDKQKVPTDDPVLHASIVEDTLKRVVSGQNKTVNPCLGVTDLTTYMNVEKIAARVAPIGDVLSAIVKGDKSFFVKETKGKRETATLVAIMDSTPDSK